ncbi:folylpolyglutamate synthase [Hyaloscypha sp. PMI_1271]|nr:folylpolyglutamate synthase [Hyaloscypha sp. PMI_1271]
MDMSYKRAIEILNTKIRPQRPSIAPTGGFPSLGRAPNTNGESGLKGTPSILGMKQWLNKLGHSASDINRLNIVHVAGTKGKGSTCAFINSFLKTHGERTGFPRKVGLYTSPYLICPEEQIRINFKPLSRDLFAKYFFEVDNILSQSHLEFDTRPRYLQSFALLSFHAFIREGVDAAIIETHHGGEYDSTNVIEKPLVTAITPLGIDHIKQLGSSIESIAWHKAGIFKSGAIAFSAPQESTAMEVLRKRGSEKSINLQFVDIDPSLPADTVQLQPDVQRVNCSLALACVRSFLAQKTKESLSISDILQGISQFSWPGRFQLVIEDRFQWFLDSAHNEMSVGIAAKWFLESSQIHRTTSPIARVLVFSMITEQRDKAAVFERLAASLKGSSVQHAIFTTYERDHKNILQSSHDQDVYAEIWKGLHPTSTVFFEPTIRGALEKAKEIGKEYGCVQTLVTGSQHLVGGALSLLGSPSA